MTYCSPFRCFVRNSVLNEECLQSFSVVDEYVETLFAEFCVCWNSALDTFPHLSDRFPLSYSKLSHIHLTYNDSSYFWIHLVEWRPAAIVRELCMLSEVVDTQRPFQIHALVCASTFLCETVFICFYRFHILSPNLNDHSSYTVNILKIVPASILQEVTPTFETFLVFVLLNQPRKVYSLRTFFYHYEVTNVKIWRCYRLNTRDKIKQSRNCIEILKIIYCAWNARISQEGHCS